VPITLPVPPTASAAPLWLRPWQPADRTALLVAHRDPLMKRWLATSLATEAEAGRWLAVQALSWETGARFSFAVVDGDDRPLGHLALKPKTTKLKTTAEVGYWIAAAARGRGVAGRALETMTQWAFSAHAINRLDLLHAEDNHASCRVAEKCGYPLREKLPPAPPDFPGNGHRHVRLRVPR